MNDPQILTYTDTLLSDQSVHRVYSDGNQEWRRLVGGLVEWQDSLGRAGVDELLGQGVLKRTFSDGRVLYGREQGYGRTVWGGGSMVTINKTSFGGRVGTLLAGLGAGALLGPVVLPPASLTPEEEEALRRQEEEAQRRTAEAGDHGGDYEAGEFDDGGDLFSEMTFVNFDFGSDDYFG